MCTHISRMAVLVLVAWLGAGSAGPPLAGWQAPAGEDAVLADFGKRIQAYVDLHRRLEGPLPTLKVSSDPTEIRSAMDALGKAIRKDRARARQGDIFSPEIAGVFRRLVGEGCGGNYEELLEIVTEELDRPLPPLRVNARWPKDAPYSMIPPKLLCGLPALPEELEYRFIRRDLVLWDMHADLIVDFITDAIPKRETSS